MQINPGRLWDRIQYWSESTPDSPALIVQAPAAPTPPVPVPAAPVPPTPTPPVQAPLTISYRKLRSMLESLIQCLRQARIEPHHTVAVILPDGLCGLVSVLGTSQAAICAPVNPALTATELRADLLATSAVAVITSPDAEVPKAVARTLNLTILEVALSPHGCDWCVSGSRAIPPSQPRQPSNSDPRILLHTSATTGRRKVVPISRENLEVMLGNTVRALQLSPDDRSLMLARLFHTQGILSPFAQWMAGGSIIIAAQLAAADICRCLRDLRPTWYTCGPTLHRALLVHLQAHPQPVSAILRFVRSGGAPLPRDLKLSLEQVLRVPVLDVYGLTETGAIACTPLGVSSAIPAHSVGRSMGPEIAVTNASGTLLAPGDEGEIVVRGPGVMAGYLGDPAANSEAFRNGWFRTGDLGSLDQEGNLFLTGRLKEIINRGGQKIVPNEIDAVLLAHSCVQEAAAFAVAHPTLGEEVACAVVPLPGSSLKEADLREFAALSLAAYKVPRRIFFVDSLPYGATGKVRRLALSQRFSTTEPAALAGLHTALAAPGNHSAEEPSARHRIPLDLRNGLELLWRRHLNAPTAQPDADFFACGGDSLSAVSLLAEAELLASLQVKLSHELFFRDPTCSNLANMTADAIAGTCDAGLSREIELVPVQSGAGNLPLFMIPPEGEEGFRYRRLARKLDPAWPLALVRPRNSWLLASGTTIAEAAAKSASIISSARPHGPCLVAGFCAGGIVAYETAVQLERQGRTVLLVLLNTPRPDAPHIVKEWRHFIRAFAAVAADARRSRVIRPVFAFTRRMLRRLAWFALRRWHPHGIWFSRLPAFQWLCRQAQAGYFPFYRAGTLAAPILHLMSANDTNPLRSLSRYRWQNVASSHIEIASIPGDHDALFDESNLCLLAETLSAWASTHAPAAEELAAACLPGHR